MSVPEPSNCTVGLLLSAAHYASRIKIKPDYLSDPEVIKEVKDQGYKIGKSVSKNATEDNIKGVKRGNTRLSAVCLEPNDLHSPIIISYGGTKKAEDWLSNFRLGLRGEVEKELREAAFEFYQEARAKYPNREIIIAGHSLGGHLAQYVGIRAFATDHPQLDSKRLVQVRTFNPAPIDTSYSKILLENPGLNPKIVNYRFENDTTSNLPIGNYLGNTFVFPCPIFWSHRIQQLKDHLSSDIVNQKVGSTPNTTMNQNILTEQISGVLNSYKCRINSQYFSSYRAGAKNLELMQIYLPKVNELVKAGNYVVALKLLNQLKPQMEGSTSQGIIKTLTRSTEFVHQTKLKEAVAASRIAHNGPIEEENTAPKFKS